LKTSCENRFGRCVTSHLWRHLVDMMRMFGSEVHRKRILEFSGEQAWLRVLWFGRLPKKLDLSSSWCHGMELVPCRCQISSNLDASHAKMCSTGRVFGPVARGGSREHPCSCRKREQHCPLLRLHALSYLGECQCHFMKASKHLGSRLRHGYKKCVHSRLTLNGFNVLLQCIKHLSGP
jgi:hypothetical protein